MSMNPFKLAAAESVYDEEDSSNHRTIASIGISAHRDVEESWRIVRLLRVANKLVEMAPTVAATVTRIHDHKGDLYAEFNSQHNEMARQFLEYIWRTESEYSEVDGTDSLGYSLGKPDLSLPFAY